MDHGFGDRMVYIYTRSGVRNKREKVESCEVDYKRDNCTT